MGTPGWVTAAAIAGTLCAVAAICITEGLFVPAALFILTAGTYELLAAVFYAVAVVGYIGYNKTSSGGGRSSRRARLNDD
jgi:hypothetical protein